MMIEQIYTSCLAQGAYYIESNGEAAIIDPLREVQPYIDKATKNGATIKYIFETHFHADFVSGHIDLSKKTGASIIYDSTASPNFESIVAYDGQLFPLGNVAIKVIHTPYHTMESSCYLLIDEMEKKLHCFLRYIVYWRCYRPDLAQKLIPELTEEILAGHLYDSLHNKIMPFTNDIVYPAHGAGSACGKNMSIETTDTLGNQKMVNYALQRNLTKEEFVKEVLKDWLHHLPIFH
jgi:glyoxylase-like metal-dependent hydrolase (beta-lactamase superfamily II)